MINFTATVYKVQTLVDGSVRVTLDLPETEIMQMAQLAECQRFGVVLEVACKTGLIQDAKSNHLEARSKRKSTWATQEETGADSGIGKLPVKNCGAPGRFEGERETLPGEPGSAGDDRGQGDPGKREDA